MEVAVQSLKRAIPCIRDSRVERIDKGWSTDLKYVVSLGGDVQLLRVASLAKLERKREEFEVLTRLQNYGLSSPEPIEFGTLPQLGICYMLLSYLPGEEASEALPRLSRKQQYSVGFRAGQELALMHQLPAPAAVAPWYERKTCKQEHYHRRYSECGLSIKGEDLLLSFVRQHIDLLKDRPNLFQHDDFHVGNIIVQKGRYVGTIDFNRFDWGDPVHDFCNVALFSREVSVPFCIGQLHGYHDNHIPGDFWLLYALYAALSILPSVVWTAAVDPDGMERMLNRVYLIIEDHDCFTRLRPKWYQE